MISDSDVRVQRVANAVARVVHAAGGKPMTLGAARDRIAYRDRDVFVQAVALALGSGTIARHDRVKLSPGVQQPEGSSSRRSAELANELDKLLGS